jgi:hypothetical protein
MAKLINFSISEISGRTFELSLKDLQKAYVELGEELNNDVTVEDMITEVLGNALTNLDEFEKNNSYFEWNLEEVQNV